MKVYEFSSIEEYFLKYVDILEVTMVAPDKRLAPREKEFLIACMVSEYKRIDVNSDRGRKFIEEHSRCNNKDWYGYKNKLIKKGWLLEHRDGFTLLNSLNCNTNKGIAKQIYFNFSLKYGQAKSSLPEEGGQVPDS